MKDTKTIYEKTFNDFKLLLDIAADIGAIELAVTLESDKFDVINIQMQELASIQPICLIKKTDKVFVADNFTYTYNGLTTTCIRK